MKKLFVVLLTLLVTSSRSFELHERVVFNGDCKSWLKDSTLPSGAFVKYIVENDVVSIRWGNHQINRLLEYEFDCNGRPNGIPWLDKVSAKYIVMRYGCGSPCWGFFILPLTRKDSVIQGMYDLDIDLDNEQMVYVNDEDYNSLTIEDLNTHNKQRVNSKIDCNAAFLGFCIDSVRLSDNKLYVEWIKWTNKQKTKVIDLVDVKL